MVNLDAPIVEVTVYVNRARITRRGNTHLMPGEETVVIANVPRTLDEDSIRASGKGANVRILGVDMAIRYVTDTPDIDAVTLQKQLDALENQDKMLADEDGQCEAQIELLKSLRENTGTRFAQAIANGKATVDKLIPLAQYMVDQLNAINSRQREIASLRRDLAKQIDVVQKQLTQQGTATSREWRDIQVTVEASAETNLVLEVNYAVNGAAWEPIYDVRLLDDKVSLTYLAQVWQKSGEDWPAVQLFLSTAHPAVSSTIPRLSPLYVDRYVPPQPRVYAKRQAQMMPGVAASAQALSEATMAYNAAPAPDAVIVQAEVETSGTSVTYKVLKPVAIPSDGSPHKTTVTTLNLEAKLDYVIVAKIATEAYLRATIKNTSESVLLPGQAQIFHGADFVGNMQIKHVIAPNEEFESQLGIEDRIKVEYELLERTVAKTFIGNIRRVTLGHKIKITNNLKAPAHLIIYDQVPVSRNEDIKIRLQDTQPKPTEVSDLNIMKWEFDQPAQSKREIPFTFVVEYPRDMTISGLDGLETSDT
jgi:uncharacterized protein (TIGR02231 family)